MSFMFCIVLKTASLSRKVDSYLSNCKSNVETTMHCLHNVYINEKLCALSVVFLRIAVDIDMDKQAVNYINHYIYRVYFGETI